MVTALKCASVCSRKYDPRSTQNGSIALIESDHAPFFQNETFVIKQQQRSFPNRTEPNQNQAIAFDHGQSNQQQQESQGDEGQDVFSQDGPRWTTKDS
mmetsp:Transcript_29493/g.68811  ORF Transcript_29493/g.68811 Transcript_29493/m.68811 type:complete len:98 (-) Transcript_29493:531-824(-)